MILFFSRLLLRLPCGLLILGLVLGLFFAPDFWQPALLALALGLLLPLQAPASSLSAAMLAGLLLQASALFSSHSLSDMLLQSALLGLALSTALSLRLLGSWPMRRRCLAAVPRLLPSADRGYLPAIAAVVGGLVLLILLQQQDAWTQWLFLVALLVAVESSGDAPRCLASLGLSSLLLQVLPHPDFLLPWALMAAVIPLLTWPLMSLTRQAVLLVGLAMLAAHQGGLPWAAMIMVSGLIWLLLPPASGPAWRSLPPFWRWFIWAKQHCDPVYAQLQSDPRPWGQVLDAGCGPGTALLTAAQRGDVGDYWGLDLDADKCVVAQALGTRLAIRFLICNTQLPTRLSRTWDTILALDILHYWPPAEQAELLSWLAERLRPEGRLWLREGLSEGRGSSRVRWGERWTTLLGLNPRQRLSFHSRAEWEALFAASGFEVCSCEPSGAANHLWQLVKKPADPRT